ncbi:MAG: hypothetical protein LBD16_08510 [Oscillospiraceae bacterium]|jgi:hypothetical protein|nr:hypothetical protein [Oscillospiraceae bacterium]
MTKLILIFAAALLLLTGCTANAPAPTVTEVPATEVPTANPSAEPTAEPAVTDFTQEPTHTTITGTVDKVEGTQIWLKETGSESVSRVLNTSAETFVADAKTGAKAEFSAIKAGDVIAAEISKAQAQSLPPQSPTFAVFVNLSEDPFPPRYAVVVSVETKQDGSVWILTDISTYWIVSATTEILNYADGGKADLAAIKEGSKLIGWYQIETRSLPGQATPTRVVVLP